MISGFALPSFLGGTGYEVMGLQQQLAMLRAVVRRPRLARAVGAAAGVGRTRGQV